MRDMDMRLGRAVANLVQAARMLDAERLDDLLENVTVEIAAALMEEEARRKAECQAALRQARKGNVVPFALPISGFEERSRDA